MALTETTRVERVLVVLNPDGSLAGAHQESLREIKDGDTVIAAQQQPAVPLDAATLAGLLPNQAALMAQVQGLTDQLAAVSADRDAKASQVAQLQAQIAALTAAPQPDPAPPTSG